MKARCIGVDFWEINDRHKWWTAKRISNFGSPHWHIVNHRGTVVASSGPTGQSVITAIEAAQDREGSK